MKTKLYEICPKVETLKKVTLQLTKCPLWTNSYYIVMLQNRLTVDSSCSVLWPPAVSLSLLWLHQYNRAAGLLCVHTFI